jgi:hypothetical protein
MRRRTERPVEPFDVVPQSVVDAARRLFDTVLGSQTHSVACASRSSSAVAASRPEAVRR